MTEPEPGPGRPTGMRLLALLLVPLLLAGCSAAPGGEAAPDPAAEPTTPPAPPSSAVPGTPGPAVVPHVDGGVARRGPVATQDALCVSDARPGFSFDGTVAAIDGSQVTFRVNETFSGTDLPATFVVEMGRPVTGRATETGPSYAVGTRMLVVGDGGKVWGCGRTVYYDEEVAAERRS